jgi:hypothetical protein
VKLILAPNHDSLTNSRDSVTVVFRDTAGYIVLSNSAFLVYRVKFAGTSNNLSVHPL